MATLTTSWKSYASASYSSGAATITFYLEAKYSSQSTANNTTNVQTRLRSAFTSGSSLSGAGYKFTCTYASTVSGSGTWYFANEVITSGSSTVTHNSDGTKSITLKASAYNKYWGFTKNLSATVSLPKINRLASITSAPNFTDEDNPTIKYSNPAGNSVTGLKASIYMSDNTTGLALYRDISKTGTSYTFNLTEEERERLRSNCVNSNSTTVRFFIRTIYGTTNYNSYVAKTLAIVNANPTMTYTKVENNTQTINYLGSSSADTVIKNVSNVTISVTPTTYKNATVSSVIINHNGVDITATESEGVYSATFDITGNTTTITTKDSRGNTVSEVWTPTVIEYQKVKQNSFSFKRVNPTSSNVRLQLDSLYYQQTFGSTANVPTVRYKIGENGTWITVPSNEYEIDNTNNKLTVDYTIVNVIDYRSRDTFFVEVSDLLSSWNNKNQIYNGIPVFEFGDDEVQVNGDLLLADINRENVINVRDALGGSGGTTDYSLLTNKPQINGNTLSGNMSTSDIGITIPTQTSQLTNNSGYITKSVNDLTNYTLTSALSSVATSGSYNDLSNTPTIPTVNDATLTIQKNGTTINTFTANSSTDKTVNVTVPTKVSDIQNDSGYITGITSSQVTTALGYTPQEEIETFDLNFHTKQDTIDLYNYIATGKLFRLSKASSSVSDSYTNYYEITHRYIDTINNTVYFDYVDEDKKIQRMQIVYTGSGNPQVTTTTYELQEKITSSNKLDYSLLDNTPTIPTKVSDLQNDSGFITTETDPVFSASASAGITSNDITNWNNKTSNIGTITSVKMNGSTVASSGEADLGTVITSHQNIKTINNTSLVGTGNMTLSTFSGSYNDLTDKPTIKEPTYSSSQYNLGYYSDPSSVVSDINNTMYLTPNEYGIDIRANTTTNLPSDLVTILGTSSTEAILKTYSTRQTNNAWAGLRQELYAPRITDRSWYRNIKGTSSGGTFGNWYEMASTSDITSYHDTSKQDTLVSGTNIKTINNTSLLGSGNINISGGGTATDVQINGTSITSGGTANILTNSSYSSSNKIATMSDIPNVPTKVSDLTNDTGFITSSSLPTKVSDLQNDSGYITSYTETDPVFSASAASGITSSNISSWNTHTNDTGWVNISATKGTWAVLRYRVIGKRVHIEGNCSSFKWSGSGGDSIKDSAIPSQYCPPTWSRHFIVRTAGVRLCNIYVTTAGNIGVDYIVNLSNGSNYTTATTIDFQISYLID